MKAGIARCLTHRKLLKKRPRAQNNLFLQTGAEVRAGSARLSPPAYSLSRSSWKRALLVFQRTSSTEEEPMEL